MLYPYGKFDGFSLVTFEMTLDWIDCSLLIFVIIIIFGPRDKPFFDLLCLCVRVLFLMLLCILYLQLQLSNILDEEDKEE